MAGKRDANRVVSALAETNDANRTPTPILVDPATGRALVDIDVSGMSAGPGYLATSTTSLLIAAASKSFTTQAGLAYTVGARVRASSAADTSNYMEGLVTSYSGTTLVVNVTRVGGSGTLNDWNINLAGDVGATGLTGATGPAGAGRRMATLVIAAVDSKDTDVASSDYQCDGAADEVQINAAIGALPAAGGRVVLMEGTFTLAAAITINKSNVVFEGQGGATIITLANNANVAVINVGSGATAYSKIVVRNLYIDGNSVNQAASNGITFGTGVTYSKVENVYVYDVKTRAISLEGDDNTVEYCTIDTSAGYGITMGFSYGTREIVRYNYFIGVATEYLSSYSDNCQMVGNYFFVNTNPTHIIYQGGQWGQVLENYMFITTGNTAATYGVYMDNSSYQNVINNTMIFNTNYAHVGVYTNQYNVQITGNYIIANNVPVGSIGIKLDGAPQGTCNNNYFLGIELGIDMSASTEEMVSQNMFFYTGNGILLTYCSNIDIIGNHFVSYAANAGYGFKSLSTSTVNGINISNNNIERCGEDAIYLQCATRCTIMGNTLLSVGKKTDNTYSGIYLGGSGAVYSTYNIVSGNNINGISAAGGIHAKYCIRENSANDGPNIITNNICLNAGTTQISAQHASTDVSHNITA